MSAILREEPALLPSTPDSPPALAQIVRRCLEKSPVERFQSARDLRFALQESLRGSDAEAMAPAARWPTRGILWVALAGLLLLALWLVRTFRPAPRLTEESAVAVHSLAVLPLENLSNDPEQEYFADGMTEALLTDLARLGAVRVVSRTSVMRYKRSQRPRPDHGPAHPRGDRPPPLGRELRAGRERHPEPPAGDRARGRRCDPHPVER
jgi:hypothetical protein